jgi:hypothetical protein
VSIVDGKTVFVPDGHGVFIFPIESRNPEDYEDE